MPSVFNPHPAKSDLMQVNEHKLSEKDILAYCREVGGLRADLSDANGYLNKIKAIAKYWRSLEPQIVEYSKPNKKRWFRLYPINWSEIFTPVEQDAWISIRRKGQIALYPQYPVLDFIVDFANPLLKIALEIDGKQFHADKEKDQRRDALLKAAGWTVFRVTGKEMWRTDYKDFSDYTDGLDWFEDGRSEIGDWILNSGDGVIEAIRCIYFIQPETTSYAIDHFVGLCYQTLNAHCTTEFDFCY